MYVRKCQTDQFESQTDVQYNRPKRNGRSNWSKRWQLSRILSKYQTDQFEAQTDVTSSQTDLEVKLISLSLKLISSIMGKTKRSLKLISWVEAALPDLSKCQTDQFEAQTDVTSGQTDQFEKG